MKGVAVAHSEKIRQEMSRLSAAAHRMIEVGSKNDPKKSPQNGPSAWSNGGYNGGANGSNANDKATCMAEMSARLSAMAQRVAANEAAAAKHRSKVEAALDILLAERAASSGGLSVEEVDDEDVESMDVHALLAEASLPGVGRRR